TAHLLRKYNPLEWGGTETAVQRLLDGLASHGIQSVVFAPRCESGAPCDPLGESGHQLRRFSAFVPVARITSEQRRQLVSIGGNLMSFDLGAKLLLEPGLALIHTHTLNRLGGIALTVARVRRLPLVATIHGGVFDLPEKVRAELAKPLKDGIEWGKIFGLLLR